VETDSGLVDTGSGGGDTADSADTAPELPSTDWSRYAGERTFLLSTDWGSCEETIEEEGRELLDGDEFEAVSALCPACSHVFENLPGQSTVCYGAITLDTTWRAVALNAEGTEATVYFYLDGSDGIYEWAYSHDSFDGEALEFAYEFELWGSTPVVVSGEMAFSLLPG
jgi:hypothetical protein